MQHAKIIAVDFDGCLCKNEFPNIGAANIDVIKRLLQEQKQGAKLILWTCRHGAKLRDVVTWCGLPPHRIFFDAVNENLPEIINRYSGTDPRKIYADEYWDDKAVRMPAQEEWEA